MVPILAVLSIFLASVFHWGQDFHGQRMYLSLVIGTLWLTGITGKRVHWSAGLCLGWTLLSALHIFGNPVSPYIGNGDLAVILFNSLSASSFATILIVVVPLLTLQSKSTRIMLDAFSWLCIADTVFVLYQWARGYDSTNRGGFFGNASMNACVIAMTYPMLIRSFKRVKTAWPAAWGLFKICAPILAVLVSRSNMALAAMVAAFVSRFFANPRNLRWERIKIPICIVGLMVLAGRYFMGAKMGNDSGRFAIWKAVMSWWSTHVNHWIGTGLGSYFILGPSVQVFGLHQMTGYLLWMHNDWLQILFEQGFLGLALAGLMLCLALRAAAKSYRYWLVASISAYAVTACGNFPMHLPVPGFFGAFLIALAFQPNASKRPVWPEER